MRKKSAGSLYENSKSSRQTVYQRGSQREGSPHYVFLYSDNEDDEAEENILLEPRRSSKAPPRQVEVIKVTLKAEDTLQALALRYRCTISELKRVNKIHKDNEIFAHRYIKVPVQPFSIFTENLSNQDSSGTSVNIENGQSCRENEELHATSRDEQLINLLPTPIVQSTTTLPQNAGINDIILNSICEPLNKSVECETSSIAQDSETEQLLSSNEIERASTPKITTMDTFSCSGADWGLSWTHLFAVFLLLGFGGPFIIYIFFIADEVSNENRQ